jgi:hypothetical protein
MNTDFRRTNMDKNLNKVSLLQETRSTNKRI